MNRTVMQREAARLEGGGWAKVRREIQATAGKAEAGSWMVQEADFGAGLVLVCKDGACEQEMLVGLAMQRREALGYTTKAGNATACALRHALSKMRPPDMDEGRVPLLAALFFLRGVPLADLARRAGMRPEVLQRALPAQTPHTVLWGEPPRYLFQRGSWKILGLHMGQHERTILLDTAAPPRLCPLVRDVA